MSMYSQEDSCRLSAKIYVKLILINSILSLSSKILFIFLLTFIFVSIFTKTVQELFQECLENAKL